MVKLSIRLMALITSLIFMSSFLQAPFCKKQGIKGKVYWLSGNQMPSPDVPPPAPKPMKTILYIYERTSRDQAKSVDGGPFYSSLSTKLIKEVRSDAEGRFKIKLAPGSYSIFTRKGELFYANTFDQFNNIAPVTVAAGVFTEIDVRVDYDAAY